MPIYRQVESRLGRSHMREWRRRALRAMGMVMLSFATCAGGLVALDTSNQPLTAKLSQAVWNAANLVTTLGSFTDFNDRQKVFLVAAIFITMIVVGYALAQLTGILSADAVLALRENRRMERQLDQLTQHVIILGYGSLGQLVAQRLTGAGDTVVIVERDADRATQASELGYHVLQADAGGANDDLLKLAGVDKAKSLAITTDDVERRLVLTLMAHALNPNLKIVVIGANRDGGALLRRAGASEVIIADDLIATALISRLGDK